MQIQKLDNIEKELTQKTTYMNHEAFLKKLTPLTEIDIINIKNRE